MDRGEIRLVAICDPHLSAYNPAAWKADFLEETEKVIRQVFQFARNHKVDAILWAGDFFNSKAPNRNPIWFMTRCIKLLQEIEVPHIGIAGNHDIKYGSVEEGLSGMPLELLIESKVFNLVDVSKRYIFKDKDLTVHVTGQSYYHGGLGEILNVDRREADKIVALGHFWFGPTTGMMFNEPVYSPTTLNQCEADIFIIGHHHEDQGVREINGKWYIAPGSINRLGAHKSDLTRKPAATFIRITKDEVNIKILRPKVRPIEDIIDVQKRKEIQNEKKELDSFISTLGQIDMTAKDPSEILKQMTLSHDVRDRVLQYLSIAETGE